MVICVQECSGVCLTLRGASQNTKDGQDVLLWFLWGLHSHGRSLDWMLGRRKRERGGRETPECFGGGGVNIP